MPGCFSDNVLDIEKLCKTIGQTLDSDDEKYTFSWAGRSNTFKNIQTTSKETLVPDKGESINFQDTENIFIEGENLEVLKLLQKSYFERIKMIYIDPPYNTGKDFIYKDNFKQSLANYLEQTNQSESGIKLTSNPETSGRYHSDWISMMYARLFVARNLLCTDGVIAVSIGDHELSNLIQLMNMIFGEENQIAIFLWKSRAKPTNTGVAKYRPQKNGEYIVVYGRNYGEKAKFNVMSIKDHIYPFTDNDGKFRTSTIITSNRGTYRRETMRFESGGYKPDEDIRWKAGKSVIDDLFATNRMFIDKDGCPHVKKYEHEESDPLYPIYTFMDSDMSGTAEMGKADLNEIIGNKHGLDTIKPVQLMKYLCTTFSSSNDIILDFFAGSCTTAQAIFELNLENNVKRKYVVVQLPEKIKEDSEAFTVGGFKKISDIGKKRLYNFIEKIKSENKQLKTNKNTDVDLGFKVFKLVKSNYRIWENYEGDDASKLKEQLKLFENPLIDKAKEMDIIYECIIKEGLDLNSKIEKVSIKSNKVHKVTGNRIFYICLDEIIYNQTLKDLPLSDEVLFICLDSALDDSQKKNIAMTCRLKTI